MTNMKDLQSMNIDELVEWLDDNGQFDGSPWMEWFDAQYCDNCKPIMCHYENSEREFPCSWCELHGDKCKFFPDMKHTPYSRDIIRMWLESEVE